MSVATVPSFEEMVARMRDARARVAAAAHRTPVARSRTLDARTGAEVVFKCEKNRYGASTDLVTEFDGVTQTFRPALSGLKGFEGAKVSTTRGQEGKRGVSCVA